MTDLDFFKVKAAKQRVLDQIAVLQEHVKLKLADLERVDQMLAQHGRTDETRETEGAA